ncbi:hypothetical protein [Microbacterium sp. NIBRBAC000506063]|uniref:hypothetical protein n=1 Tax=Microbacterium sp. NIBRBAC000506063 TaxID=2734618 RepID=UPI001BB6AAD8|nr:hypothetical protein [Microbacterium sp. NIBRBAC000506063]QTV79457.1 hypothetical protein KAE78_11175 [Microbacterium sp. NIBRBAC000506063]
MADPFDDPAAREWAQRAIDDLLPKIRESAATISIVPDDAGVTDIKFAVELGLSAMLDKPVIIAVTPGRKIPERLARIADEIVEFDPHDQPATARRMREAIKRVLSA